MYAYSPYTYHLILFLIALTMSQAQHIPRDNNQADAYDYVKAVEISPNVPSREQQEYPEQPPHPDSAKNTLQQQHLHHQQTQNQQQQQQQINQQNQQQQQQQGQREQMVEPKLIKVKRPHPHYLEDPDHPARKKVVDEASQIQTHHTDDRYQPSYVTMSLIVDAYKINCIYYKAKSSFDVEFQLIKGGASGFKVTVKDPDNRVVLSESDRNDATLNVVVPSHFRRADYAICADNRGSSGGGAGQKRVFFMIDAPEAASEPRVSPHPQDDANSPENREREQQKQEAAQAQESLSSTASMFVSGTDMIGDLLSRVQAHQDRHRAIEAHDRNIAELNYTRVTFWSICQLIFMVFVAVIQVVTVRSLFTADAGGSNAGGGGVMAGFWRVVDAATQSVFGAAGDGSAATRNSRSGGAF